MWSSQAPSICTTQGRWCSLPERGLVCRATTTPPGRTRLRLGGMAQARAAPKKGRTPPPGCVQPPALSCESWTMHPPSPSITHTFPALWLSVSKEIVYFCPPSLSILSQPCPRWQDPKGIHILSDIISPAHLHLLGCWQSPVEQLSAVLACHHLHAGCPLHAALLWLLCWHQQKRHVGPTQAGSGRAAPGLRADPWWQILHLSPCCMQCPSGRSRCSAGGKWSLIASRETPAQALAVLLGMMQSPLPTRRGYRDE